MKWLSCGGEGFGRLKTKSQVFVLRRRQREESIGRIRQRVGKLRHGQDVCHSLGFSAQFAVSDALPPSELVD
jgi:hypothetical protein